MATFSKPTHMLLIAPLLALPLLRSQWRRAVEIGAVFAASWSALVRRQHAVTGEWNYQGGDRKTFYSGGGDFQGGFPFQTEAATFDTVGLGRVGGGSFDVLVHPRRAASRSSGTTSPTSSSAGTPASRSISFPGLMAILLFLRARREIARCGSG